MPTPERDPDKTHKRKSDGNGKPVPPRKIFGDMIHVRGRRGTFAGFLRRTIRSTDGICTHSTRCQSAGLAECGNMEGTTSRWQSMDGAMIKAPSDRKMAGCNPTDRKKNGRRRHLLVDGNGFFSHSRSSQPQQIDMMSASWLTHFMELVRDRADTDQYLLADSGYALDPAFQTVKDRRYTPHARQRGEKIHEKKDNPDHKASRYSIKTDRS